jgi:hypothetical protein
VQLVLENTFPRDHMSTGRPINQSPSAIGLESMELLFRGAMPVRIMKCSVHRGG